MTTAEVVKALAERLQITQRQARELLDSYTGAISRQLSQDHAVILRNFGTFSVKSIAEKQSYIPAKGMLCTIPAHRKVSFKAAKKLREKVSRE